MVYVYRAGTPEAARQEFGEQLSAPRPRSPAFNTGGSPQLAKALSWSSRWRPHGQTDHEPLVIPNLKVEPVPELHRYGDGLFVVRAVNFARWRGEMAVFADCENAVDDCKPPCLKEPATRKSTKLFWEGYGRVKANSHKIDRLSGLRGSVMAIRYYLDGKAFDPEAIQVMSEAFTSVAPISA
jgi:hypothetical protein